MAVSERIESLRTRHAALEAELEEMMLRPMPSPEDVHRVKREKLKLKDEISRLSTETRH